MEHLHMHGPFVSSNAAGRELVLREEAAVAALDYLQTVAVALETLERMMHNHGERDDATMATVVGVGRGAMAGLVGLVARPGTTTAAAATGPLREAYNEDESTDRGRRPGFRRRVVGGVGDVRPSG